VLEERDYQTDAMTNTKHHSITKKLNRISILNFRNNPNAAPTRHLAPTTWKIHSSWPV